MEHYVSIFFCLMSVFDDFKISGMNGRKLMRSDELNIGGRRRLPGLEMKEKWFRFLWKTSGFT